MTVDVSLLVAEMMENDVQDAEAGLMKGRVQGNSTFLSWG